MVSALRVGFLVELSTTLLQVLVATNKHDSRNTFQHNPTRYGIRMLGASGSLAEHAYNSVYEETRPNSKVKLKWHT